MDAAAVMRSVVECLRTEGFAGRPVDMRNPDEDAWDKNFAQIEVEIYEPSDRRYFDYDQYCFDLGDSIAKSFKNAGGRFRVVWGRNPKVKPGERILHFRPSPYWRMEACFYVEPKKRPKARNTPKSRASASP